MTMQPTWADPPSLLRFALALSEVTTREGLVRALSEAGTDLLGARAAAIAVRTGDAVARIGASVALEPGSPLARAATEVALVVEGLRIAAPVARAGQVVGAIEVEGVAVSVSGVARLAELLAPALVRVLERERIREATDRLQFVARATELLLVSLDLDETLRTVARLAVPAFADWAAVDRIAPDGQVRRVAVFHVDPQRVALAHELFERFGPTRQEIAAFQAAGAPVLVEHLSDEILALAAKDAEHLRISRELGLRSLITVPLVTRGGAVTGALSFMYAESGRNYAPGDVPLAVELAARASAAIENAHLYGELQRAQAGQQEARRWFERIAVASPDVLYVVSIRDGRTLFLNRSLEAALGLPGPTEPLDLLALLHPDDGDVLLDAGRRAGALADGEVLEQGYRLRHADGTWRWFEVRSTVFARDDSGAPTEILALARDVTGERSQAQALAQSELRHRLATEALQGLVYDWEISNGSVSHSEGLRELVGYEPASGRDAAWWVARIHPDDRPATSEGFSAAIAEGARVIQAEYRVLHRDGRWRWVNDSARIVRDEQGSPIRLVGCTVDVTARVDAQRALEDADRRKDQFLALLSHELRNPLAAIRHAAQVLGAAPAPDALVDRARQVIGRQVQHMGRLLEDLLDLSRILNGKLVLRPVLVDVSHVIEQVVGDHRAEAERRGVSLRAQSSLASVWVRGDEVRLAQILVNLVENALKYTDRGGEVGVTIDSVDGSARVTVADTGIGIDPESLGNLFEPFIQSGASVDRAQGGLGLGLSLVRGLVTLHGGTVTAHSAGRGQGSRFTFLVPLAEAPPSAHPMPARATRPLRILVVEDNADGADMLRTLLEIAGHAVAVAPDGSSAIAEAERFAPDVVLCDIGLPGEIDGHGVARALRARATRALLVAVTGWGRAADVERSLAAGFDRHLTKPIDPALLERVLGDTEARAQAFGSPR